MKKVKLEDVCYSSSSSISQKDIMLLDGKYSVYGASGLIKNINYYKYEKEYVGIVKDGAGVGRTMILPAKSSVISTIQYILPKDNINTRYLYYVLSFMNLSKYYSGVTIPHIYFKDYKYEEFFLPNKSEQQKIVNKLDLIQEIIDIRKKQIKKLDELIKSQFVEMFGDPILNDKKYMDKEIGEISEIVSGTTPDTSNKDNWNGNINWITPAEINDETFYVFETERKITEQGRKSKSLTVMPRGTVIFSTRAPIGKTAIAGIEMCCNQGFKNCICNNEINNVYLYYVLKNNKEYFNSLGTGATFKELSKRVFEKVKISVPPIELQNKFADFVKKIDKQKFKIQKSLEEMQKLQESLMNEYFGDV